MSSGNGSDASLLHDPGLCALSSTVGVVGREWVARQPNYGACIGELHWPLSARDLFCSRNLADLVPCRLVARQTLRERSGTDLRARGAAGSAAAMAVPKQG